MTPAMEPALASMRAAGLSEQEPQEWSEALPGPTGAYDADAREHSAFWRRSAALLGSCRPKPRRNAGRTGGRGGAAVGRARRARIVSRGSMSMRSTTF